ncbi:MAG TPA: tyrosine-protein phosphatase [Gaiellaceae bacterium]|nr:tyrosine-protein phosphatase [Gaiellaceae bacterium]
MLRELAWEGCVNVRALGPGIVRSDNVRKLSDAGWEAAWAHGVRTVVDLRSEPECADDPPLRDGVAHVRIGLSDFDRPQREDPDDRAEALRLWYWEHLEHNPAGIAAVFRVLADADGGVLVHCLGGKDRTGIVSMLLLRLRGASIAEIEADYMLSEPNLKQVFEVIHAPAGVVGPVLERLEARHGSVEAYLLELGLTPAQVGRLRAKLAA